MEGKREFAIVNIFFSLRKVEAMILPYRVEAKRGFFIYFDLALQVIPFARMHPTLRKRCQKRPRR